MPSGGLISVASTSTTIMTPVALSAGAKIGNVANIMDTLSIKVPQTRQSRVRISARPTASDLKLVTHCVIFGHGGKTA